MAQKKYKHRQNKTVFLRSLIPFIMAIVFMLAVQVAMIFVSAAGSGDSFADAMAAYTENTAMNAQTSLICGIVLFVIFTIWYRIRFVRNDLYQQEGEQQGFSLPLILGLFILAVGMYLICVFLLNGLEKAMPDLYAQYESLMETQGDLGFDQESIMLLAYIVVLGPVAEEIIFRGLVFRLTNRTMGFWFANIWQAALFGVYHLNVIQGIYAFVMGLFLGYIAYHGRSIRFSIYVHIAFNVLGIALESFFTGVSTMFPQAAFGIGCVLAAFAIFVFADEFHVLQKFREYRREQRLAREEA